MEVLNLSVIPRYLSISKSIESAIKQGQLSAGLVLTEEPLARHFNTSRTTIRKALAALNSAKQISKFDGRGFIVGSDPDIEPKRGSIEQVLFDPSASTSTPRAISKPDHILPILRDELIRALPFGPLLLNETKLTERFSVSRSVIREILSQLRSSGIVEKNERAKWVLPVLTASDVRNHYQLRILLEPVALIEAAPFLSRTQITEALVRIEAFRKNNNQVSVSDISELEETLHVQTLSACHNEHLLNTLQKSRLVLAINEMFRLILGRSPASERLIEEHFAIFEALACDQFNTAGELLKNHLTEACERTCKRLQTLSVLNPPELPVYLSQGTLTINQTSFSNSLSRVKATRNKL